MAGPPPGPACYLIDGSAYLYRAFHALPPLTTSRGVPTNAVLGFATMLLKVVRERQPGYLGVAFDGPGPTVRHRAFAEYKAQRPPMPEALAQQVPHVHRVVEALRVPLLLVEGEEADDILATLARQARERGVPVVIVTGDKDLLQLVADGITVYEPMRDRWYDRDEVVARYGVPPDALADLFGLTGDAIDNVPGVPGVGEKTARALLQEFGSLEGLLAGLGKVARPKLRESLAAHAQQARRSRELVRARTDVPVPVDLEALRRRPPDGEAFLALCRELEFTRLGSSFAQGNLLS
ncbi:MAG TPA: 5'-3' exonuclease H3TH domain-containing protein [Candidatus Methylomirabilis sp.]|jgi:DNA polymerase-1